MAVTSVGKADAYFSRRIARGKVVTAALWPSSMDADTKNAYLETAEAELSAAFRVSIQATDSHAQAVCEQVLLHLVDSGVEQRMALQAQGVTHAGIVQESYAGAPVNGIAVAPIARSLLGAGGAFRVGGLSRPDLADTASSGPSSLV